MMRFMFQRESVPVLDAALSFAHQKQLTIANNIANVNTPYYKRQSVPEAEFQDALTEAIQERRNQHPSRFYMRNTPNIDMRHAGMLPRAERESGQEFGPERHDENSVVIEKEMSDLAKNTIYMETMQTLLRKKYSMLRASVRGTVA